MTLRRIEFDEATPGKFPYKEWFETLDERVKGKIESRLNRLENGNKGDHRNLDPGLFELKIDFGPGYRVYCGEKDGTLYVILGGGDKGSQKKDIKKAQKRWAEIRGVKWRQILKTIARIT